MADKDTRITFRCRADLAAWIAGQGENEGLDSATWIRATLMRMMKGIVHRPAELAQVPDSADAEAPTEPVDIDALVSAGLEEAQALGAAQQETAQAEASNGGVRPVFRQQMPFSGPMPNWIDRQ